MKKLTLKETQAPYTVALDEAAVTDEIVILEKNGHPVAALVPIEEYEAFQAWRTQDQHSEERRAEKVTIDPEHDAFLQMQPALKTQYSGKAVAIYQGEVIGVGDDKMALWMQMRQKLGPIAIYVQHVDYPHRVAKMSSPKVVKR